GKASRIILKSDDDLRLADLNFFPVPGSVARIRLVDATGIPDIDKNCVDVSLATPGSNFITGVSNCLKTGETESIRLPILAAGKCDFYGGGGGFPGGKGV